MVIFVCCLESPGVALIVCYCRCNPSVSVGLVLVMPRYVVWCRKYYVCFYVVLHA